MFSDEVDGEFEGSVNDVVDNLENGNPADMQTDEGTYAADVMNNAMQRIEEANLFKTLINQSVFGPNSARPEILDSVNRKIQQFAIAQLEELLGIRNPATAVQAESAFDANETQALKMLAINFTDIEVRVLKMLIAKVLKTDPVAAASSVNNVERKPELLQIKTEAPKLNQIQTQPKLAAPAQPQQRQQQQVRTQQAQQQRPQQQRSRRQKAGLTRPNAQTKVKAMPSADQLIPSMGMPGVVASRETKGSGGVSEAEMTRGAMSVASVVQQLTGGNVLAVDNSNPADAAMDGGGVDVNSRF